MGWTESQSKAIETSQKTLLVSAGAGSGKTTVLTERILKQIREGASVTDFLVVTFTKASASDLKAKLHRALSVLAAEHPNERHFRTQQYLLPDARISTIHSYCLAVVRANFQKLGLSPKVRMADEQETNMIASDVMETVIDEFYESGNEGFALLADTFSGTKDDGPLSQTMLELYGRLRAYADYFEWLEERATELEQDAAAMENGLFSTHLGGRLQEKLQEWFSDLAHASEALYAYVVSASDTGKSVETAAYWQEQTRLLSVAAGRSYAELRAAVAAFRQTDQPRISYGKMPASAKQFYGAERDRIKKETEKLISFFAVGTEAQLKEQFSKTAAILRACLFFLKRFEELYALAKREKDLMDFSDAEHFLYRLLEENGQPTPLCLTLRESLREICIDEYQDVSPLQDRIFSLLSRGNNRFMVGDVKQSIYRFRNAYPDIFLSYKDAFPDVTPEHRDSPTGRIFLRENFRSGEQILRFTNLLFRCCTTGTPYEREYAGEELVFAREGQGLQKPVTVALSVHEERSKEEAVKQEAAYIAEEILRLIRSGTHDSKNGVVPYRYGDVALLFRALKGATAPYEQALRERGIPFSVTTPDPFFEQPEILLVLSLLQTVDDPTDDIALASVLRSPIGKFDAQDLYLLRRNTPRGSLYRCVQEGSEGEGELSERCRWFLNELELLREKARETACHTFLWELYARTGLLHLCTRRQRKGLLLLYEYARGFENGGYKGLSGFLSYLNTAKEKGIELPGGSENASADRVLLTTIHRSKGLEYPAVFLCNGDRDLFGKHAKPYRLLRSEGLFFKLRDYEKLTVTDTLPNRFAALLERDAELGEELRKLYVACTRAQDKLYITGCVRQKQLDTKLFSPRSPQCFLDLVLYTCMTAPEDTSFERIRISEEEAGFHMAVEAEADRQAACPLLTEEVIQAIRYRYPYADSAIPAKVSVSELKQQFAETTLQETYRQQSITRAPAFLRQERQDGALRGTANHIFLQFCDFSSVEQNGVRAEAERLLAKRMLTNEQVALLQTEKLKRFFSGELYARMRQSKALYREQRFSVRAPASVLGGSEQETVLLQGVVDCFFAEADGSLTVVDYKTDRVSDGRELLEAYHTQLACYRYAVSKMTGKPVGRTAIWSFALQKEIIDLATE